MRTIQFTVSDRSLENMVRLSGGANRSEAARFILKPILISLNARVPGLRHAIDVAIEETKPSNVRADDQYATEVWGKQIVWLPETMLGDITQVARSYKATPSAFIRGAIHWACHPRKNNAG